MGKYIDSTGLSHLIGLCKAAFAAITHNHSASDVTSGTLSLARGGTGVSASSSEDLLVNLLIDSTDNDGVLFLDGDEIYGGVVPVAYGGTGETNAAGARANLGFGEVKTASSSSVSAANNANTNFRSISLTKGVWLVCGRAQFASNATGRRAAKLSATSGDTSNPVSSMTVAAINGANTHISVTRFFTVTSASQTIYLVGWHNAGSTLTCYGEIEAVRIG